MTHSKKLSSRIKKYFWHIVVFFLVAITSGVFLANQEAKSRATWKNFTSKEAGLSFKYPKAFTVIEDKGWRITVYPSQNTPETNIKILYSHANPESSDMTAEEQFLANCQAKRVTEVAATGARMKVYEDSTCGSQVVENSIIVYSENGMSYDIGLFGSIDRNQLYQFLATFSFEKVQAIPTVVETPSSSPSALPSQIPLLMPDKFKNGEGMTICTMDAKICPDGTTVGRTGPNCEFVCPGSKAL